MDQRGRRTGEPNSLTHHKPHCPSQKAILQMQRRVVELRLQKIQLQVGEERIRYYLRSSSHEPKNGEGSVKDTSFSSDGEDLNDRGTGERDSGARQPHAPQAPCTSLKKSSDDGGARRGQLEPAAGATADCPDQKGLVVDKGQVRSSPGG